MKLLLQSSDINNISQAVIEGLKPLLASGNKSEDQIFDVKGLSEYLHVSESWAYERSRLNEIPKTKPYGVLLFRKSDIDKWLNDHSSPAVKGPPGKLRRALDK